MVGCVAGGLGVEAGPRASGVRGGAGDHGGGFARARRPLKLAREISWAALLLVAGLFVMVRAVETVGACG